MRKSRSLCLVLSFATVALVVASCKDSTAPTTGTVRVIITTTGTDMDVDGYVLSVDGEDPRAVTIRDTITIGGLDEQEHSIMLSGLASNCTVADNPALATVAAGAVLETSFTVSCAARLGNIIVTTISGGQDIGSQPYGLRLDGFHQGTIATTGTVELTGIHEGAHELTLTSVPTNCTVLGSNPRTVNVTYLQNSTVQFAITCARRNGELRVVVATNGIDLDTDGYMLRIDNGQVMGIASSSTTTIPGLQEGVHTITLSNVQENCTVAEPHPRSATVIYAQTVSVSILVTCVRRQGAIRVIAATTGTDLDPNGYRLIVDDLPVRTLAVNGVQDYPELATDVTHSVYLYDIARNCVLAGEQYRSGLQVPLRGTLVIMFSLQCVQGGSIRVAATTTGVELDASGYQVGIQGQGLDTLVTLSTNGGIATASTLLPGGYALTLLDVAGNCEVGGTIPRLVNVTAGAITDLSFDVTCEASGTLAYSATPTGDYDIYSIQTSGAGNTQLTSAVGADVEPDWSPNGARIVFRSERDGNAEIYVMNANGSGVVRLTNNPATDMQPVWSPDGTRIAFVSSRAGAPEIYVMNADGQNVVRLTTNTWIDGDPSWSPDGTKIVFRSYAPGNGEIYVMNADGSNPTRLTFNETEDKDPAWSPDGNSIAFVRNVCLGGYCGYERIFTITPAGTGLQQITEGEAARTPAWSPDGRKIAYSGMYCEYDGSYFWCYDTVSILTLATGASIDVMQVGSGYDPAWRR